MVPKNSAQIFVDYPITDISFINNKTIIVCGGGGESKSGVPNKITAIRCSFKTKDKSRRLQKFREVNLPQNEDSPLCLAVAKSLEGVESPEFSVLVGCNQSQQLRAVNVNNNVRKYSYLENNHFAFRDAAQFDEDVLLKPRFEDPKHVQVAPDFSVAVMMTTATPSELVIFSPSRFECINKIIPSLYSEIVDLHLCPFDNGKTLTYITATSVSTVYTQTGEEIAVDPSNTARTKRTFSEYFLSKVCYLNPSKVLLAASLKSKKGTALLEYNIQTGKVTKKKLLFRNSRVVALEYCEANGLSAIALNDFSVSLIRASDFKILKTYKNLHNFAITCLSFCPNGSKLASGSAAQTLNVLKLDKPSNFLGRVFRLFFWAIFVALLAFIVQIFAHSGHFNQYFSLLEQHGGGAYLQAQKYGRLTYDFSRHYGAQYYVIAQHQGGVYLDYAQRYGRLGYELAKEKSGENYSLLKKKVDDWRSSKSSETEYSGVWTSQIPTTKTPSTFTPTSAISIASTITRSEISQDLKASESPKIAQNPGLSQSPEISQVVESSSLHSSIYFASTASDIMSVHTKQVDTENLDNIDTLSLISEAIRLGTVELVTSTAAENFSSINSNAGAIAVLVVQELDPSTADISMVKGLKLVDPSDPVELTESSTISSSLSELSGSKDSQKSDSFESSVVIAKPLSSESSNSPVQHISLEQAEQKIVKALSSDIYTPETTFLETNTEKIPIILETIKTTTETTVEEGTTKVLETSIEKKISESTLPSSSPNVSSIPRSSSQSSAKDISFSTAYSTFLNGLTHNTNMFSAKTFQLPKYLKETDETLADLEETATFRVPDVSQPILKTNHRTLDLEPAAEENTIVSRMNSEGLVASETLETLDLSVSTATTKISVLTKISTVTVVESSSLPTSESIETPSLEPSSIEIVSIESSVSTFAPLTVTETTGTQEPNVEHDEF